ncbi:MAG: diacylglycerol kinase family protein [Clostridia bacterium]|nr:diacylglycerol kinase family protein [Clostridia bacterium]
MQNKLSFFASFFNALRGIYYCIINERHMRIHLFFAVAAVFLSWYLKISSIEWLLVVLVITLVITLEMINSAIERTVDLYTTDAHPLAQIAKDVAAGAVLFAALCALIIGAVVFLPKLCKYF